LLLTLIHPPPHKPPLFPYTTLFRSVSPLRAKPVGARTQRLWPKFYSDTAHHCAWRIGALSLWRQTTPSAGGSEYHRVAIEGIIRDRKSTRLNSSHQIISYAVFCLKK